MSASGAKSCACLGFLTVVEQPDGSSCGGLLVLNVAGRPLEFHCTAPVKANRAQEILYGFTLRSFVFGEQIGAALVQKTQLAPQWICTDVPPALALREACDVPAACIRSAAAASDAVAAGSPLDRAAEFTTDLVEFTLGGSTLAVSARFAEDRELIRQHWQASGCRLDLTEPFTRIREALEEAQRTVKAA